MGGMEGGNRLAKKKRWGLCQGEGELCQLGWDRRGGR